MNKKGNKQERNKNKDCKHIKGDSFILIKAFMVSDLKLKGNDLLVYAIIHGFSHSDGGSFTGSLQYLAEWTGSSKQAIMNTLKKLESSKLIRKSEQIVNSIKHCTYKVISLEEVYKLVAQGMQLSCMGMQPSCMGMQLSCTNIIEYNIEDKKEYNNISSDEDSNNHADEVSVKMYEQSVDVNCTFPILDSTEPIYDIKAKETKPKVKEKKPSKYDANPERFKFINEKTKEWNLTASDDIKIRPPRKGEKESNNWVISRLYDKFGLEKAEIIFNYVMSKGNYRQPHGLLSTKNVQDALASYQDPNDEQPRFLIDFWKTMRRFSKPDSLEPFMLDFNTEDALYAAWEWYFNGKGLEGGELVKAVREKIKEINHPRFNKY